MPKRVQLLVEGKDDFNFFETLIRRLGRTDVEVRDYGGRDRLRSFLLELRKSAGFTEVRVLAITRDADGPVTDARRSVSDAATDAGLPEPRAGDGAPGDDAVPEVRIHILGGDGGMLETLLNRTVEEEPEQRCVEEFLQCVEEKRGREVRNPHKSRVHAWIATRDHPEVSVGVAAQKDYWPLEHRVLDDLRSFLRSL